MPWRKIKQRTLGNTRVRDSFTMLNEAAKEVANEKVEFVHNAGIDKKATICVPM